MRTILIAGVLAVLCSTSFAQEVRAPIITGGGTRSCAQYAGESKKLDPVLVEGIYLAWAQGYMSGMNVVHISRGDPYRNLLTYSGEEQARRLRALCDSRPQARFYEVVTDFYRTLEPTQTRKPRKRGRPRSR